MWRCVLPAVGCLLKCKFSQSWMLVGYVSLPPWWRGLCAFTQVSSCPVCVVLVSCCELYVLRLGQAVFALQLWPSFIASLGGVVVKLIVTSASCPNYVKNEKKKDSQHCIFCPAAIAAIVLQYMAVLEYGACLHADFARLLVGKK